MTKLPAIVGLTASLAASVGAQAAILQSIRGDVLVNRGGGYAAVHGTTEVKTGDIVMVDANGKARLVFPDGCQEEVPAGSVTTVSATSPCSQRLGAVPLALGGMAIVGGMAGALAATTTAPQAPPPFVPPLPVSP
jgi:hypothetical protein